jgi:tetratricopeptide (TPR) repeat protein
MQAALALQRFWWTRGHQAESRRWLETLLGFRDALTPELFARGLADHAFVAGEQGDLSAALSSAEESLLISEELVDEELAMNALDVLASTYGALDRYPEAEASYERALSIARQRGLTFREAALSYNLAHVVLMQAHPDLPRARLLMENASRLARETGSQEGVASSLVGLGSLLRREGELDQSLATLRHALVELSKIGFPVRSATALVEVSAVLSEKNDFECAARLLGAAEAAFDAAAVEMEDLAGEVESRLMLALGAASYVKFKNDGRAMELDDAIEYALASID